MAERRMFSKSVIGSARFLMMPPSSRLLYYDLGMAADDDGIVEAYAVMRMTGAVEDDLRVLVSKGFLSLLNADLVAYITDWNQNNQIRKDRYRPSVYQNLLVQLSDGNQMATNGKPMVNQTATQYRLGKGSLGKVSIDSNVGDKSPRTQKAGAEKKSEVYKHIVDYLNAKAGTQYKASCKDTKAKIDARLAENFTVTDFETVIDKKCEEWRGTEWEKFLRPLTLFGPKFESYLNAKIISSNKAAPKPNRARDFGNKRTYTAEEIDSMGNDLLGGD